jgi:hypothetical protein
MSKPLPLKIGIVGENGLVFLLSALLPQDHELLKPCRCRMTTSRCHPAWTQERGVSRLNER